jgi:hypothetical protein
MTPITLRKQKEKIRIENKFGLHLADLTKHDTEFFEPVTETELLSICKVASNFSLFHENIIEE